MAMNEIRQQARRSAAERVARLRQQRADLVKKQEELSATVMTALAERDAVIADAERRAGAALRELASSGLSLAQAAQWCELVDKEAARLVKFDGDKLERLSLGDEGIALRFRQQARGDTDRPAGIEDMNHRPVIGRVDAQRSVNL